MSLSKKCKARTARGAPCNANAGASGYCFAHDPKRKREADRARRLGGKHRRRVVCIEPFPDADALTVGGLARIIAAVMRQTWTLEHSIARARALAYLAQVQRGILETSDLERRIAALEERIKGGQYEQTTQAIG